jgi:DnaK suppressor protein
MTIDEKTLQELKEMLLAEKTQLEAELSRLGKKINEKGDYETVFPENLGEHDEENATEVEQYTDNLAVEVSLETQLKDVLDALEKMDHGVYGIDEVTGEDIMIDRLRVYPAARRNITA